MLLSDSSNIFCKAIQSQSISNSNSFSFFLVLFFNSSFSFCNLSIRFNIVRASLFLIVVAMSSTFNANLNCFSNSSIPDLLLVIATNPWQLLFVDDL